MPQVAGEAIRERAKRLRAAGEAALVRRLGAEVGATREVLIESERQGRTEHFLPVAIDGDVPGMVRRLTVAGPDGARLSIVIPGLAEGESPESMGPHSSSKNGFRVLASRAPE